MKIFYYLLTVIVFNGMQLMSQEVVSLVPLSEADKKKLAALPEWPFEPQTRRIELPAVVDNSATPYMRPLVSQVGLECGQASSIGIQFTYEINAKRKVPGNLPENQYATHFTYNFLNGGSNAGISYYESFEIVKYAGNPSVATYGGMATGGPSRWMDGYANYLSAMKNRIENLYSIKTNTVEGLLKVKHWIYDHGDGSEMGGMVSFYSQFTNPPNVFPAGVPEAGKHVITWWGSSPDHAMTIVGYNDNIRWDYNGDGQYTNHVDLNGDGIIDVRDWEIGGFKMANTYGSISGWGDQGFSYMMYKTLADATGQGGIWNNQVVVAEVKENYMPALTAKVNLTYSCRNKLKIMAGLSLDPLATTPEYSLNFPMFDFQGGCNPMQGIGSSSSIEIGLDLTPLLVHLPSGQQAKYFLTIIEDDPTSAYSGTINGYSIIDYTGSGAVQMVYPQTNIPIQNNTATHLGILATIHYPIVSVDTTNLSPVTLYVPQQVQLQAMGGQAPYYWYKLYEVQTQHAQSLMPLTGGQKLNLTNNSDGFAEVQLPFSFPYFGEKYNKIYPSVDGFIMFEPSLSPWPYYIAGRSYLIQKKIVAPALSKPFQITAATDGIWAEVLDNQVIIRWKLSVYGMSGNGHVNMVARLHSDGRIEFFYGSFTVSSFIARFAGISAGDGINYTLLHGPGFFTPSIQQHTTFITQYQAETVKVSLRGKMEVMINEYIDSLAVRLLVRDRNGISNRRTYYLKPQGMLMEYTYSAGGDQTISFGETVVVDVQLTNINPFVVTDGQLSLQIEDPYITSVSGSISLPSLEPGATVSFPAAFLFEVGLQVPDQYNFSANLSYVTLDGSWTRPLLFKAHSPNLLLQNLQVNDGQNGILEPGETASLIFNLRNTGSASLQGIEFQLLTSDLYTTVVTDSAFAASWPPGASLPVSFVVQLNAQTPLQHTITFTLDLASEQGYTKQFTIPLMTSLVVENFESGGFTTFAWEMVGQAPWVIATQQPWEGDRCARSGTIPNSAASELKLNYNVAFADSISFYYKVSSENNYDFLKFFVGGVQKAQWSGEKPWSRAVFSVAAGPTSFRWRYEKDFSVASGSDCAWLDYIVFPSRTVFTHIELREPPQVRFYPNPAGDWLAVEMMAEDNDIWHFVLTDAMGKLVTQWHQRPDSGTPRRISLSQLNAGYYHLIWTNGKSTFSKSLIRY